MMLYEIRWFSDKNFVEIENWWHSIELPYDDEGERTDYYILLPNMDNLGVKFREGRLEIKWRIPKSQKRFETLNLEGLTEEWVKWSWDDTSSQLNHPSVDFLSEYPHGPMIKILKNRLSRKFKLSSDDIFEPVKWLDMSESGFSMELTQISLEESRWWSVGFETLGNKLSLESFQTQIKEMTLTIPLKLKLENSFGYPKWISQVSHH